MYYIRKLPYIFKVLFIDFDRDGWRKVINVIALKLKILFIGLPKRFLISFNKFSPYQDNFLYKEISKTKTPHNSQDYRDTYNSYYENEKYRSKTSYGMMFINETVKRFKPDTILDVGSGAGIVVRHLRKLGYQSFGVELSDKVIAANCLDLEKKGYVYNGSTKSLPFKDSSFDLIFSSDVLEHIPENEIDEAVKEIVRVAKKNIFMSISLRPSSENNKYHITLKPRNWWEKKFIENGCTVNSDVLKETQQVNPSMSVKEILHTGPSKTIAHEMEWFYDNPPFDYNGELEP
tara:strand:+ start:143 stop:1012 length:870 start_codon:yes stop_codon:yes gene_type:complete